MSVNLRNTGIDIIGAVAWGAHFCHFYETQGDLLGTVIPYLKAGLESGEYCVWMISAPLTVEAAWALLKAQIPDIDRHRAERNIEIDVGRTWYLQDGTIDRERVIRGWNDMLAAARERGHPGMRVTGDTAWLPKTQWHGFCEYEREFNDSVTSQTMMVLCTCPLATSSAAEMLDMTRTHQFVTAKRVGQWERFETPELEQAKAGIERLNAETEHRVVERTSELVASIEAMVLEMGGRHRTAERLREVEAEILHAGLVMTLGEAMASIAHEISQPLTAISTNAHACLRWMALADIGGGKVRAAVERIIDDSGRAAAVIERIRTLIKKPVPQKVRLDLNEAIREVVLLLECEAHAKGAALRTELSEDLPIILADRIQLQQVIVNLIVNGVEAMGGTETATGLARDLTIRSRRSTPGTLAVQVSDLGTGIADANVELIFDPFFTTKPHRLGMGLSISRSIIEVHGGKLSATANDGPGTTFHFTLPI